MSTALVSPRWFKILSWTFAALFFVSAGLQYNDPDPLRWIALYGGAAVITIVLPLRLRIHPAAVVLGAVAAIWCGYLGARVMGLVSFSDLFLKMSEKGGRVEEAREAGGLLIVSLWLATAATIAKWIIKRSSGNQSAAK
ncbi:MAG TPA: transmembrane 220 family protein [Kofleriaceae bacterium]|nr:transmembrane 220 family protein [Kofleriaceae bacterium]